MDRTDVINRVIELNDNISSLVELKFYLVGKIDSGAMFSSICQRHIDSLTEAIKKLRSARDYNIKKHKSTCDITDAEEILLKK